MTSLIKVPFAQSGDKTEVPITDAGGGVNWTQGYPVAYSKDPATDPSAKRIERELFNGLMNRISTAINEIQTKGVSPYITPTDNGGTAFAYDVGAIVNYNNKVWISLVTANTVTPAEGANWSEITFTGKLGTAAARNVGEGTDQLPDMSFFANQLVASAAGYFKLPGGLIFQWSNRLIMPQASNTVGGMGVARWTFPIAFPISMCTGGATLSGVVTYTPSQSPTTAMATAAVTRTYVDVGSGYLASTSSINAWAIGF